MKPCIECGKRISQQATRCMVCARLRSKFAVVEPSEEEIAERAAEIKERNLARMADNSPDHLRSRKAFPKRVRSGQQEMER